LKQKAAVRIVCNAGYRDHTAPLFKQLGILPLNELIKYSNLKFMHNFSHRKLPLSFHDMWTTNRERNPNLALRNADNLYIPAHNFATLKKLPLFSFPKIWNEGVSTKMVKFIGSEISFPLSHIFNLSLSCGIFPNKLKLCRVIPIFKSGNSSECDNYRPISLLSSISKLLEKIVAKKLVDHLLDNDLLYVHQYGFLPNRSTEHNLLQIVNYVSQALNEGNYRSVLGSEKSNRRVFA
jgi:hypothetical protein